MQAKKTATCFSQLIIKLCHVHSATKAHHLSKELALRKFVVNQTKGLRQVC